MEPLHFINEQYLDSPVQLLEKMESPVAIKKRDERKRFLELEVDKEIKRLKLQEESVSPSSPSSPSSPIPIKEKVILYQNILNKLPSTPIIPLRSTESQKHSFIHFSKSGLKYRFVQI